MDNPPEFAALDWFKITGRGWVAATVLDRETYDFAHLHGKQVVIDGVTYTCRGVERFLHNAPWRKGEKIGLLVEGPPTMSPEMAHAVELRRQQQAATAAYAAALRNG